MSTQFRIRNPGNHIERRVHASVTTFVLFACLGFACAAAAQNTEIPQGGVRPGDDLLVVDCMLPGQVRQLGTMRTYLTARRPIKTTARDCAIRGGEYVAYDRANYATALKVWLPRAKAGNAQAQVNVGDIFAKGMGLPPDYQAAAVWYRRAAEQGSSVAAIDLGALYEQGQGVPKNPKEALKWYRRGAGLPDAIIMDTKTVQQNQQQMAQVRQENQRLRQQLEKARSDLEKTRKKLLRRESELQVQRKKLADARNRVELRLRSATSAGDTAKARKLKDELDARQQELDERDSQLASLRSEIARVASVAASRQEQIAKLVEEKNNTADTLRAQVNRNQKEADYLQAQLDQAQLQLQQTRERLERQAASSTTAQTSASKSKQQVTALMQRLDDAHGELLHVTALLDRTTSALDQEHSHVDKLRRQLEQERASSGRNEGEMQRLQAELAQRAQDNARRESDLASLSKQLAAVQRQEREYRGQLAKLEQEREAAKNATTTVAATSPPIIEMLDPRVLTTRGAPAETVLRSAVSTRQLVGKVTAAAGLMSLTVNDESHKVGQSGLFRADIPITGARTPVTVVAVDRKGNLSTLSFDIVRQQPPAKVASSALEPSPPQTTGVDLGSYYALIIGNDDYRKLPKLQTAVADAKAVEKVLRTKYGFNTKLLLNATRYQILSALNELREKLTDKDNLVIYYAGHGELDRKNARGNWLPVDAGPDNTANWISNTAITDILNVMNAREILVVADSCYSGALTRSALGRLRSGMSLQEKQRWMRLMVKKRSRTVLTSGGDQPVLDSAGGAHSVFAAAFLKVLRNNKGVLEGARLYGEIAKRMREALRDVPFNQVPEYAPLKFAGHEGGDFFFVPRA